MVVCLRACVAVDGGRAEFGDVAAVSRPVQLNARPAWLHLVRRVCGARPKSVGTRALPFDLGVEALWEIVENSTFVIEQYRTATAALGYAGDTVINSLGDILCCGVGFEIARRGGVRWTAALFAVTEVILLLWIVDTR